MSFLFPAHVFTKFLLVNTMSWQLVNSSARSCVIRRYIKLPITSFANDTAPSMSHIQSEVLQHSGRHPASGN